MNQGYRNLLVEIGLKEIAKERTRQNAKWGVQRHPLEKWLVILIEEVGEFAQTLQTNDVQAKETDASNKQEEIRHVAAVACAILEQLIEEENDANNDQ